MNSEYDESIVQKFEAIGEAHNIKTRAQGRKISLTKGYINESPLNKGKPAKFNLLLTCNTIINHNKSSQKQKEFAKKIFNQGYCNIIELNIIMSIRKRLK